MRDDYRQGRRANCIQGRRSRMDAPNNTLPQRHSRRSCFVISAVGGIDELSPGTAGQLYSRAAEQYGCAEQHAPTTSFSPLMFVISAFGGNDEQLSEAEKIAGSDFSRA